MKPGLLVTGAVLVLATQAALAASDPPGVIDERHKALVREHCMKCHNAEESKGKSRVDTLPFAITSLAAAERWQKVLDALNSDSMPPEEKRRPLVLRPREGDDGHQRAGQSQPRRGREAQRHRPGVRLVPGLEAARRKLRPAGRGLLPRVPVGDVDVGRWGTGEAAVPIVRRITVLEDHDGETGQFRRGNDGTCRKIA